MIREAIVLIACSTHLKEKSSVLLLMRQFYFLSCFVTQSKQDYFHYTDLEWNPVFHLNLHLKSTSFSNRISSITIPNL